MKCDGKPPERIIAAQNRWEIRSRRPLNGPATHLEVPIAFASFNPEMKR
jgi:hypothetical protein